MASEQYNTKYMNLLLASIKSFFNLIRLQNLIFIVITQYCFYFLVIAPAFQQSGESVNLSFFDFQLLVLASVLIAGAGYVINDYFDLNIDRINKPQKLVIDRFISRRWAMFLHLFFSIAGVIISAYVSISLGTPLILFFNILSVFLLFIYSSTFKKKLLSGNIIIAALSSWVILVLFLASCQWTKGSLIPVWSNSLKEIYKLSVIYSSFAFIVSLIREVIKDIEDETGDQETDVKPCQLYGGLGLPKYLSEYGSLFCLGCFQYFFST